MPSPPSARAAPLQCPRRGHTPADGGGRFGGGHRPPELVDGSQDAHGRTSMVGAVYAPAMADDLLSA